MLKTTHPQGGSFVSKGRAAGAALVLTLASSCVAGGTGSINGKDPPGSDTGDPAELPDDLPPGSDETSLLPSRIRRLSNAEYDRSVQALLGTTKSPGASFVPDTRQNGFTVNDAQRVDPVLAGQLATAAEELAKEAVSERLQQIAPCADTTAATGCAAAFIESFGARAYRRPLTSDEAAALNTVYGVGAGNGGYANGVQLVIRAVLQSAGFLYHTEIGTTGSEGSVVALTPEELASELSFLVTAAPPDESLLAAASGGELDTPDGRESRVRGLLATPLAKSRLTRVIQEWLGIDRIEETAKDAVVYPNFEQLRPQIARESSDFIEAVLFRGSGTLSELLSADWTIASGELAAAYGGSPGGDGKLQLSGRRGILNQAAFLSVYAHAHESAPVLRGVAVIRKLTCLPMKSPTELNIMVTPPVPDPNKTTRERFSIHATDTMCASCHQVIDPLGFTFENFDAMGMSRTTEKERPVDTTATLEANSEFDGSYTDSVDLVERLAQNEAVRSCFAEHLFRYAAARDDAAPRDTFLRIWRELPDDKRNNVLEAVVAYVRSPLFTHRRAQ